MATTYQNNPSSFFVRTGFSLMPACLVTLGLLYMMLLLVHSDIPLDASDPTPPMPNVIATIEDVIEIRVDEERPVKPQPVETPPELTLDPLIEIPETKGGVAWGKTTIDTSGGIRPGIALGGQPMPVVRINPAYPASAASRNVEGYVDVIFDITPMGTTTNIRIVGYEPSTVFNASVLKAVRGWKYRPGGNDEPAIVRDVRERINFRMEK